MDILDRLYKQLELLSQHKDFNESCTIIDILDAIKEITRLNEVVNSQKETIAIMQNIIDSEVTK